MSAPKRLRFASPTASVEGMSEILDRPSGEPLGTLEPIPISRIVFDPDQPRQLHVSRVNPADIAENDPEGEIKRAELEGLQELADSIRENGLIEAVGVYRHGHDYRLIWGERRVLASILAQQETVLARLYPERPRNVRSQQLIENVIRKGLTLSERIRGVRQVIEERKKDGVPLQGAADLAKTIGWGQATAYAYWGIANGPDDVLAAIDRGVLNDFKLAYSIAAILDDAGRAAAIEAAGQAPVVGPLEAVVAATPKRSASTVVAKRGRPTTSISLGKTKSTSVARYVCERLLDKKEFAAYHDADWDDMNTAADILRQVLKRIEQKFVK